MSVHDKKEEMTMMKLYVTPDVEIVRVDDLLLTVTNSGEQINDNISFDWDVYT